MELREFATRILSADTLEEKLASPLSLSDRDPGSAIVWDTPTRPVGLGFVPYTKKEKLPPLHEMKEADKRAVALHRFAGHELLAVEIMAYALLAFPDAPKHFRKGVANTLKEEQEHVRLYQNALATLGVDLTDLPFYKNFWALTHHLKTPMQYISVMHLTLEGANLDFAPLFAKTFAQYDDLSSAQLMQRIFEDEIRHVSFGTAWLKKWKGAKTEWDAWLDSLPSFINPRRARGKTFGKEARKRAGFSDEWIEKLEKAT